VIKFVCTLCGSRNWPNDHTDCPLCRLDDEDDEDDDEEEE